MALDDAIGNDQLPDFSGDDVLDRVARSMNIPAGANGDMILNRLNRKLAAPEENEKEKAAKAAKPAKPDLSKYGTPVDQLPDLSSFGTPADQQVPMPQPRPAEAPQPSLGITGNIVAGAKGVPAGAAQSVGGILKGGAALYQGGVPASPEQPQYDIMGNPTGQTVAPTEGIPAQPLQERGLYKAGQAVENVAPTLTPAEQESLGGRIGIMAGGIAPYAAATLVNPTVGLAAGFTGMAADTYGKVYEDAKAKGADEETATKAASRSALVAGVLGSLPLSAGKYVESLAAKVLSSSAAFATAGEAQEALLQQIAKDYDPKAGYTLDQKRLIAELILGAGMGGLHHAFEGKPATPPGATPAAPSAGLPPPGGGTGPQPGGPGPQPGGPGAGPSVFTGRTRYDAGNGWWERERKDGKWEQFVPPGGGQPPPGGAGAGAQSGSGPGPQPNQGGPGAQAKPGASGPQPGPQPGKPPPGAGEGKGQEFTFADARMRAKFEKIFGMYEPGKDPSKMADHELYNAVNEHLRDTSSTGYTTKEDTAQEKAQRDQHATKQAEDADLKKAFAWMTDAQIASMTPAAREVWLKRARGAQEPPPKQESAPKPTDDETTLRDFGYDDATIKGMAAGTKRSTAEQLRKSYPNGPPSPKTEPNPAQEQPAYESGTDKANRENQTAQKNTQSDIPQETKAGKGVEKKVGDRIMVRIQNTKTGALTESYIPFTVRSIRPNGEYVIDHPVHGKLIGSPTVITNAAYASDHAASGTREEPIRPQAAADVAAATPAEPTPAQAEAENYRHAHMELPQFGLKGKNSVSIETGVGQERKGVDRNGKPWSVTLKHGAYGRIKGSKGADGQPLDVFVGPHPTSPHAFIIDQHDPETGQFDEHKIMLGYRTPIDAMHAYANSYADGGKDRIGHVTAMGPDEFKTWLQGDTTQPLKTQLGTPLVSAATEIPPGNGETRARSPLTAGAKADTEASPEASKREVPEAVPGGDVGEREPNQTVPSDQPTVSSQKNAESSSQKSVAPQKTEPLSLTQFIASKGGIVPDQETRAIGLAGEQRIQLPGQKGFFAIVRPTGMKLDMMREAAEEAGYLRGEHNKTSTVRDLLDAIDAELRGQKRHAEGEEGTKTKRELKLNKEREAAERERDEATYGAARQAIKDAGYEDLPSDLHEAAAKLIVNEGLDPDTAIDRASVELVADEDDHVRAIEAALGSDADLVAQVDIARAAELMGQHRGMDIATAFGHAVIETAVEQKFLTPEQVEKAYGEEVNDVLGTVSEGSSSSSAHAEQGRAAPDKERAGSAKEAGELPGRSKTSKAKRAKNPLSPQPIGSEWLAHREAAAPAKAAERSAASGKSAARNEGRNAAEHKPAAEATDNAKLAVKPKLPKLANGETSSDGKLTYLSESEKNAEGKSNYSFSYESPKGKLDISAHQEGQTIHVDKVSASGKGVYDTDLANQLGIKEVRSLLKDLQEFFPNANKAFGYRAKEGVNIEREAIASIPEPTASKESVTEKGPFPVDKVLAAYDAIKQRSGGVSGAYIGDLIKDTGIPKDAMHKWLLEQAKAGKLTLHPSTTTGEAGYVKDAAINLPGHPDPLVNVYFKPALTTEKGPDNKEQLVIPGAEKASEATMAKRAAAAPLKPKAAQKSMDVGLFGDESKQSDLLDHLNEALKKDGNVTLGAMGNPQETIKAVKAFWTSTFQPELVSDRALRADPLFAKYKSAQASEKDSIIKQSESDWNYWNKQSEDDRLDFLNRFERVRYGANFVNAREDAMAKRYRTLLDANWAEEQRWGSQAAFVEDYMPHIWEKPDAWRAFSQAQSAQQGTTWFQKKRTIDYINEGLAAGLKLKYTNPVDIIVHRLLSGVDMRQRMQLLYALKDQGLAWEGKQGGQQLVKRGWQLINAPDRKQWVIHPDAQLLWKNAVEAKGLWQAEHLGGSMFRGWMSFKNAWLPVKLAMSAFHPLHVLHINYSNGMAQGWDDIVKGRDPMAALKSVANGFMGPLVAAPGASVGAAIGTVAGATVGMPVWGGIAGSIAGAGAFAGAKKLGIARDVNTEAKRAKEAWLTRPARRTPDQKAVVELMNDGGFVPQLSEQLKIAAKRELAVAFQKILRREAGPMDFKRFVTKGIKSAIEVLQAPIFEKWIPQLKTAAYLNAAAALLKRRPELLTYHNDRRLALRAIAKSIDNRFGEMFYGGLFWNRYLKDAGTGTFLSLGWNLGFVREFGGAAVEAAARPAGLIPQLKPSASRRDIRNATNKIAFAIAYMASSALILGIMSKLLSDGNENPSGLDFIFPRSGGVNPDGSPRRYTQMSYSREIPMLMKHIEERGGNVLTGTADMIYNKMLIEPFLELKNNRDYYGYNIWDENAPIYKKIWQGMRHGLFGESAPMSATGAGQAARLSGKEFPSFTESLAHPDRLLDALKAKGVDMAMLGFGPAPSYVEKTAIQNRIGYLYGEHVAPKSRPYADEENSKEKMAVRTAIMIAKRDQDSNMMELARERGRAIGLSPKYMSEIGKTPTDVYLFSKLPEDDQLSLIRGMNDEEKDRYLKHASKKTRIELNRERYAPTPTTPQPTTAPVLRQHQDT